MPAFPNSLDTTGAWRAIGMLNVVLPNAKAHNNTFFLPWNAQIIEKVRFVKNEEYGGNDGDY